MIRNDDELTRMVLIAVADDYEEFEMIVSEILDWTTKVDNAPEVFQIEQALMKSITDKDVEAYEISEPPNQIVATKADPQKIHALWFYITEQGKRKLESLGGGWTEFEAGEKRYCSGSTVNSGRGSDTI